MEDDELECSIGIDNPSISIPRGGPIYVSNMSGPIVRVPLFQDSLLSQLHSLQSELPPQHHDYDITVVDDLKVFTEDELMDMSLKQVFQNQPNAEDHHHQKKKLFRRKSRLTNKSILDSNCKEKVDKVVRIKHKQEEDKAQVTLHSFHPHCRINQSANKSIKTQRMMSLRSTSSATKLNTVGLQEHIPVQDSEVVLSVEIYHNFRNGVKVFSAKKKTQELLVLGGQNLSVLRDKINCSTDQVMQKAAQHDPSGYFLIEDVFYTDLRDPSAIDLTRPILDWLQNSKEEAQKKWEYIINGELQQKQKAIVGEASVSHLPRFASFEMHKIHFCDLGFRLGAGYLYCHQGDCTHTLVIRDMRLIHADDVQNWAVYPIVTFQLKIRFQKCGVCKIFRATKVTVDDKWTPDNPCYFCDECFSLLHLAEDGSPTYTDFIEYDYNHD
ncbi:putative snRNA-activating protein complex, subunit 3 [Medicago truncatula]|uniref:Putative snRNA-activating protein complex, subunit 3 n=2 Tax=Medicago truncatula TaxID=3880 RepID=A0A072USC4_MEDTR|nr:snRNA activating complex family protein [Medicago truncatula]RHN65131.1 putative snRNA-activating protein complex, subunit 3 [Medicago truncatula]